MEKDLIVLDLGFMKMLEILDVEMLWRVIGSFIWCSRRFPMKVFQHDVLSNVAKICSGSGISVDGKDLMAFNVIDLCFG